LRLVPLGRHWFVKGVWEGEDVHFVDMKMTPAKIQALKARIVLSMRRHE